jgi:hypothetical protein
MRRPLDLQVVRAFLALAIQADYRRCMTSGAA